MLSELKHIAILAGGNSRRMGTNKARLVFDQKILIDRLVEDACNIGLSPLVCSDDAMYPEVESLSRYSDDFLEGKAGALSAFQPALEYSYKQGEMWLWVYACDALIKPSELLPYLQDTLNRTIEEVPERTMIIVPKAHKQLPLMALYRTSLYASLKDYLMDGNRRVMQFCAHHETLEVEIPNNLSDCCNFNTPEQFELGTLQYRKHTQLTHS